MGKSAGEDIGTLGGLLACLGEKEILIEAYDEVLWDEAMASYPETVPYYLTDNYVRLNCEYCFIEPEDERYLLETAGIVRDDIHLSRLSWYVHWRTFISDKGPTHQWPLLGGILGDRCGSFYLLVSFSMISLLRESHWKLGVPEAITKETCRQIGSFIGNYKRGFKGVPGMYGSQFNWLRMYLKGNIYVRLERLEFWIKPYWGGITVYRNSRTNDVAAISDPGIEFTHEGYVRNRNVPQDGTDGWTSVFSEDAGYVTGNLIHPSGSALKKTIRLDKGEWKRVLGKDSCVLDMHIPAGGGLSPEIFESSIRRAISFFKDHFPQYDPVATVCHSWLFNPNIDDVLPGTSNLCMIQKDLYLYPILCGAEDGLWFIYLMSKFDIESAPRDTSLQRAVADYIGAGKRWRSGGMFFLLDDIGSWGSEKYRSGVERLK